MKSVFRKIWDPENGYTLSEAAIKAFKVDEAHGVGRPESKWQSAKIVRDPQTPSGYMVTIETKN